jgi:ornithine cyclodeaminase/alanine dehydrogenase-like protein (mu-crystallin family)
MVLIIEDADVAQLLSMQECIEAMEVAFRDRGQQRAVNLPRIRYACETPNPGVRYGTNIHIGAVPSAGVAAVRLGSGLRAEAGVRMAQHQARNWGIVCLFSLETAELLAILQEFALSGIRVGATTALGVKYLAREDASTVGLFGSGKLARAHVEALALVRPIRQVRVYSPTPAHREAFAAEMSEQLGLQIVPVDSPREAMRGVDLVCCATNAGYVSGAPVFDGDWLEPGQVVTTIQNTDVHGFKSEVDERTFARSEAIVINDRESVYANNQRELLEPIEKGLVSWDHVLELGDLVAGTATARSRPDNLVYFKNSTGMGIQMAAAGAVVYRNAVQRGVGHQVPSEWFGGDLSAWYDKGFIPSA